MNEALKAFRIAFRSALRDMRVGALLSLAVQNAERLPCDRDLMRGVLTASLVTGNRDAAVDIGRAMIDGGRVTGDLMLALEGLCMLRNLGADVTTLRADLLADIESRGFDPMPMPPTNTNVEPVVPDEPEGDQAAALLPRALAQVARMRAPYVAKRWQWVPLLSQLPPDALAQVVDNLHIEMRGDDEPVLRPPHVVIGWVVSGAVKVDDRYRELQSGALIYPREDQTLPTTALHLRLLGVSEDIWTTLLERREISTLAQRIWQGDHARLALFQSPQLRDATPAALSDLLANARTATMTERLATSGGKDRIALVVRGRVQVSPKDADIPAPLVLSTGAIVRYHRDVRIGGSDPVELLTWDSEEFLSNALRHGLELQHVVSLTQAELAAGDETGT